MDSGVFSNKLQCKTTQDPRPCLTQSLEDQAKIIICVPIGTGIVPICIPFTKMFFENLTSEITVGIPSTTPNL